ncbi:hypothetical protein [Domibacillus mangrovi]|uniref:Uncharacterized protein n=1 Tax=Domibacillus mangrovi TaxID=1714354 RepID=A0A1Q5P464_9BACI|nr:hypothetical protein [Domibacillus mangrovi]OKL36882.1 hypothetical protein BLL40_09190 [Domibacillus mangrovi]
MAENAETSCESKFAISLGRCRNKTTSLIYIKLLARNSILFFMMGKEFIRTEQLQEWYVQKKQGWQPFFVGDNTVKQAKTYRDFQRKRRLFAIYPRLTGSKTLTSILIEIEKG